MTLRSVLSALSLTMAGAAAAQQAADSFPLTIENIMRGEEVVGRPPSRVRWTADGKWLYFM